MFGGVWRQAEADSALGIRFRLAIKWTPWYKPEGVDPANMGAVIMDIPDGRPADMHDFWLIEMCRLKYTRSRAYALAEEVEFILRDSMRAPQQLERTSSRARLSADVRGASAAGKEVDDGLPPHTI